MTDPTQLNPAHSPAFALVILTIAIGLCCPLAAGEVAPPAPPPPVTPPPAVTIAPAPVPPAFPTPAAAAATPPLPPLIPSDLPEGVSIVHFYLGDDIQLLRMMFHHDRLYGYLDGDIVDFDMDNVKGLVSNAPSEVQLKPGNLPLNARKSLLTQGLFYFMLDNDAQMLLPDRAVVGLYPPDRFRFYPAVFHKFIAPWGTIYDQRPFYFQIDLGYVLTQAAQKAEIATGHMATGSDLGLYRIRLEGDANFGRSNGLITANDQRGQLKADRILGPWIYGYVKTGLLHDDVNGISYRWSQGIGLGLGAFSLESVRFGLFNTPLRTHKLDLELGIDHINEKNRDGTQQGWFGRLAAIDRIQFDDHVDFDNRIEYLPSLVVGSPAERGKYFVHYHSELRVRVVGNIALRIAYNLDYNSKPPVATPMATHQLTINLSFAFGL